MATTTQHNDFDRVKRWGNEFLATAEAGTGGTGRSRADAQTRPQSDLGKMTAGTTRFNPSPGWPPAPAGWVPPPGRQPDPSRPDPPAEWQLWVEDRPATSPNAQDFLLAIAGGIAVVLGSLMPWVSATSAGAEIKPRAKAASVVLGLVVAALGFALRAAPAPGRLAAAIATLCLSSLAGLLYAGFIVAGLHGVPEQDPFGDMTTVTYSPDIGTILAVTGCGAAFVAGLMSFHHRQHTAQMRQRLGY